MLKEVDHGASERSGADQRRDVWSVSPNTNVLDALRLMDKKDMAHLLVTE